MTSPDKLAPKRPRVAGHKAKNPRIPKTKDEKAKSRAKVEERDAAVQKSIENVERLIESETTWLAEMHGKTKDEYKNMLLGSVKTVKKQQNKNGWTLFLANKTKESGSNTKLMDVQKEASDEWREKSQKERDAWKEEYLLQNPDNSAIRAKKIMRKTPKARAGAFNSSTKMIGDLMTEMHLEQGASGFAVIVRGNSDVNVDPFVFSTCPKVFPYVSKSCPGSGFDQASVATKLEAYAIAGMDAMNLNTRSNQAITQGTKSGIRFSIARGLQDIVGRPVKMHYTKFVPNIVQEYSVNLVGWPAPPAPPFGNPAHMTSHLPSLTILKKALDSGECHWKSIDDDEVSRIVGEWTADGGKLGNKKRKERADKGKKHKKRGAEQDLGDTEDDESDENDESDESDEGDGDGDDMIEMEIEALTARKGKSAKDGKGTKKGKSGTKGGTTASGKTPIAKAKIALAKAKLKTKDLVVTSKVKAKPKPKAKKKIVETEGERRPEGNPMGGGEQSVVINPAEVDGLFTMGLRVDGDFDVPGPGDIDPALGAIEATPAPSSSPPLIPTPSVSAPLGPPGPGSGILPPRWPTPPPLPTPVPLPNPGAGYAWVPVETAPVVVVEEEGGRGKRNKRPKKVWVSGEYAPRKKQKTGKD